MKLSKVTRGECGLKPISLDKELEVCHDDGVRTAVAAKHVDDIKIGGKPSVRKEEIIPALEAVFTFHSPSTPVEMACWC